MRKRGKSKAGDRQKSLLQSALTVIGVIAVISVVLYAIYRFFAPDYLDEFEEEFDEDFETFFDKEDTLKEEDAAPAADTGESAPAADSDESISAGIDCEA